MPSWAGIRRHSRTYATLLSAKSPEDDRPASSRAGSHFKQLSPATLDGQSSSSSDYGEDPESAHRQAVRLQYGHQSARADREESPVAPEPVVGSRSSYSTPVDGKDGRRYAGNKVNFKAWGLKRSLSNLSHKEKKTSSAVQTEHKHALSLPPGRKHVHTKDQAKTKEAQTVLQLITGLDTIYLPFTNLALTKAESTQVSLPDVSSKDVRKLKGQ